MGRKKSTKAAKATRPTSQAQETQEAQEEPVPDTVDHLIPELEKSTAPPTASQAQVVTVAEVHQSSSDNEEDEIGKSQKRRRRDLTTADFTEEQEQEMVDWLQAPKQDVLLVA